MGENVETNKQIVLRRVAQGMPAPDDFELVESPLPQPGDGEVLVRTIYLSLDPYMRGGNGQSEVGRQGSVWRRGR